MIRALVAWPELSEVRLFEAGVEPENIASIQCLLAAGFRPYRSKPDYEGMLYFTLLRRPRTLLIPASRLSERQWIVTTKSRSLGESQDPWRHPMLCLVHSLVPS